MTKNPNKFPEVRQVLQARWLKIQIRSRIHTLKLGSFISEEDVVQHVVMCLIETLNSGTQVHHPIAWAKLVSQRYISKLYKKYRMSEATELDKIEYLANLCYHENRSYNNNEEIFHNIQQLKSSSREIINMRFFQGLSWEQVAAILSRQENKRIYAATARKRGERAINELRQIYVNKLAS